MFESIPNMFDLYVEEINIRPLVFRIMFNDKNNIVVWQIISSTSNVKSYLYIMYKYDTSRNKSRVANITDFSLEVRNLEIDPYFSRFLYGVSKFSDFAISWFFSTFFIIIGNYHRLRPWSSWTADSDRKYMELNGAVLNVNKPHVTSWKTAFLKDK